MKQPRVPRTVIIDHLSASKPREVGFFKRVMICDYDSPEGTVREYHSRKKKSPEYRILKTKEKVNIEFSATLIADLEKYFSDID